MTKQPTYQKIISDNHGDYDISYVQNEYVEQLDFTEYVEELDPAEYVEQLDFTEYLEQLDLTEYVEELDLTEYVEQLDPTEYVGKLESEHSFIIKFILFCKKTFNTWV